MPYIKSGLKKRQLTTSALLRVALVLLRARMGERLSVCTFKKQNTQTQVKKKHN